jgi:hypothetical protein
VGHTQPAIPLRTDNSTAFGILNETIKQKTSKTMDMRYHWLTDKVLQKQFCVVELVQHAFEMVELPTEFPLSVLVLIPKGSGGCRWIGLLEICWKVISKIMDFRMKQGIDFDDSIHGFRAERGTSTSNIEAKLQIQLSCVRRQTLYQVFIDPAKAYDTLDRGQTLEILEGHGVWKKISVY